MISAGIDASLRICGTWKVKFAGLVERTSKPLPGIFVSAHIFDCCRNSLAVVDSLRLTITMKYLTPALCALLATTGHAQEENARTSVAERPTFTVSMTTFSDQVPVLTSLAYQSQSALPRAIYRRLGDTMEAVPRQEGRLAIRRGLGICGRMVS